MEEPSASGSCVMKDKENTLDIFYSISSSVSFIALEGWTSPLLPARGRQEGVRQGGAERRGAVLHRRRGLGVAFAAYSRAGAGVEGLYAVGWGRVGGGSEGLRAVITVILVSSKLIDP